MLEDKLIAALDPNGFRPLSTGNNGATGSNLETCALKCWSSGFGCKLGEVVIIDDNGITYDNYTTDTQLAVCSMESTLLARPDPISKGQCPCQPVNAWGPLAREFKHEADIVVGVPNFT